MTGGYVYVIAFDNGIVKVGRSQHVRKRLKSHEGMGRSLGVAATAKWESPEHDGWIENERELMRLARELGGVPITEEYFTGVCFGDLAAKAAGLPFPAPRPAPQEPARDRRKGSLRKMPQWLASDFAEYTHNLIPRRGCTVEDAAVQLADRVLTNPEIMRLLAEQYAGRQLRKLLKRIPGGMPEAGRDKPEPPEPPDPQPPLSTAAPNRGRLRLVVAGAAADLAAKAA